MYVIAMNRLRAEYARLVPGVERGFMSSLHDDRAGSEHTYYFFEPHGRRTHIAGSSMVFIIAVNSVLFGLLTATVVVIAGGMTLVAVIVGLVAALAFFAVSVWLSARPYFEAWKGHVPVSPTPRRRPRPRRPPRSPRGSCGSSRGPPKNCSAPTIAPDDHRHHRRGRRSTGRTASTGMTSSESVAPPRRMSAHSPEARRQMNAVPAM